MLALTLWLSYEYSGEKILQNEALKKLIMSFVSSLTLDESPSQEKFITLMKLILYI